MPASGPRCGCRSRRALLAAGGDDRLGAPDEWGVDHLAVDRECGQAAGGGGARGVQHALRVGQFGRVGAEGLVGQRHLARVDAALAPETETARHLRLLQVAGAVADIGKRAIVGEHARFGRGHAQAEHRGVHVGPVAARNPVRLEQVGEAELQTSHARIGAGDAARQRQAGRRLDIGEDADRPRHLIGRFGALEHRHAGGDVGFGFGLGQIEQRQRALRDGQHVGLEMGAADGVDAHDDDFVARQRLRRAEKFGDMGARLVLAVFGDRVFQVDRDGIGRSLQRFDEQLGARSRHK